MNAHEPTTDPMSEALRHGVRMSASTSVKGQHLRSLNARLVGTLSDQSLEVGRVKAVLSDLIAALIVEEDTLADMQARGELGWQRALAAVSDGDPTHTKDTP